MAVEYPPEPILGEAACQILYRQEGRLAFSEERLARLLDVFVGSCIKGLVSAGKIGELLARVMLAVAHDRAHLRNPSLATDCGFSLPVPLDAFLRELVAGQEAKLLAMFGCDLVSAPTTFSTGEVCFTSWVALGKTPPRSQLQPYMELCFGRRCAVIMPGNQEGADLMIPVRVRPTEKDAFYTYILIQVKNRVHHGSRLSDAGERLTPRGVFGSRWRRAGS
jgi:hypothetical protein